MSTDSEKKTILSTANVHQVDDTWRFPLAFVEKKVCEDSKYTNHMTKTISDSHPSIA